jgi:hypothetical protein
VAQHATVAPQERFHKDGMDMPTKGEEACQLCGKYYDLTPLTRICSNRPSDDVPRHDTTTFQDVLEISEDHLAAILVANSGYLCMKECKLEHTPKSTPLCALGCLGATSGMDVFHTYYSNICLFYIVCGTYRTSFSQKKKKSLRIRADIASAHYIGHYLYC